MIELTHNRAMCKRHGEPFKAAWPKGYAIFCAMAAQYVLNDLAFLGEAVEASGHQKPDPNYANVLLDLKPACCRLPDEFLLDLYEKSPIAKLRHCKNCNRQNLGAPYNTGRQSFDHLCFQCVVNHMSPEH